MLSLTLIFVSPSKAYARIQDEVITKKVDFILEVANQVTKENTALEKHYKIGVVGKGSEHRQLIKALEKKVEHLEIQGLPVKIDSYSKLKSAKKVDLLVISGDIKIRPSELKTMLADVNYVMLTENYPFGMSSLNYTIDKEDNLIYEVQEQPLEEKGFTVKKRIRNNPNRISSLEMWQKKLHFAEEIIKSQSKAISSKRDIIIQKKDEIGEQQKTISVKDQEIGEKSKTINSQRSLLIVALVSIILISFLLLVILKINAQRKKAMVEIQQKNLDILNSLNYAKKLQKALLPTTDTISPIFDAHFVFFKPKDIVSGDFYWMETKGDKIYFAVADCTGHGVPGAMMSVICSKALTKSVKDLHIADPAKILDRTVEELNGYFSKSDVTINDGMDISLICIDKKNQTLTYSGAHNPLYFFVNNELQVLYADKQPVGAYDYRQPFAQQTLPLGSLEMVYLFTDGYTDQFGGDRDKKFSKKRFRTLLETIQSQSMAEQHNALELEFNDWQGQQEQVDDVCVAGINFKAYHV